MPNPINILFICTGNINRSAAAHIILEFHNSGKYRVKSCGTGKGAPLNKLIAKRMRIILSDMGYDPEGFRSRAICSEEVEKADRIIVMANAHIKHLQEHYPEAMNKVTLWPIPDPHFASGMELHRAVAKEIQERILAEFD